MNKSKAKKVLGFGFVLYVLNVLGGQVEKNKRLEMENKTLKKQLNQTWDRTELN